MAVVRIGDRAFDPNSAQGMQELFDAGYQYFDGKWQLFEELPEYVQAGETPPILATADKGSSLTNTIFGTMQNSSPGIMTNVLSGGVWSGFNPNDIAGGLAVIRAYSLDVYGSVDLGTVRYSSEVLENEPSGVRPGTMERIVIPAWARRERGSPL